MGKVAICIPCYNSREKLKRLLDSIAVQDFNDYVVIITDDSDNDVVKDLIVGYPQMNIQYYKNYKRLGSTGNTNRVLQYAQHLDVDYIKIMHHDDSFSFPGSLSRMVQTLDNNIDAEMAFSSTYEIRNEVSYERIISEEQIKALKKDCFYLAYFNIIGAPSTTIIRKNNILLDERLVWFVDIDWYIQILRRNKEWIFIQEPLITTGLSNTQVTCMCVNDPRLILDESIYLYRKYQELQCLDYMNLILEETEKMMIRCDLYQIYVQGMEIYIYGAGEIGKMCAEYLMRNHISYKAFIVSDGRKYNNSLCGHQIIELSEFVIVHQKEKSIVILALNEKNRNDVIEEFGKTGSRYIIWK